MAAAEAAVAGTALHPEQAAEGTDSVQEPAGTEAAEASADNLADTAPEAQAAAPVPVVLSAADPDG